MLRPSPVNTISEAISAPQSIARNLITNHKGVDVIASPLRFIDPLNENNEVVRVGGVKYTISNGVIYDAKGLLNEVKMMVDKAKEEEGFEIKQPGVN